MPSLMKHQEEVVAYLRNTVSNMLAWSMGTGKTCVAISLIADDIASKRTPKGSVVICPASLVYNWRKEVAIWAPHLKVSIEGDKGPADPKADIIVASYDRMERIRAHMHVRQSVIFDEAHYLCHFAAKRTKLAHSIVKQASMKRLLLMTGTPLSTKIPDLYSLLCLLDTADDQGFRKGFRTYAQFSETFCNVQIIQLPHIRYPLKKYTGCKNLDYLKPWLWKWWLRCTLKQVVDLPPLTIDRLAAPELDAAVAKSLMVAYQKHVNGVETGEHKFGESVGEHISTAKASSALAKAPHTAEFVRDMLAAGEGPILVFSDHVAAAKCICDCLKRESRELNNADRVERKERTRIELITGETTMIRRSNYVDAFQRGDLDCIVATIGTLQVGLTLTRGNICVVNDKNWKPAANQQAYGRMYRISQTRPVFIYEIVGGEIDEKIMDDLAQKEKTINAVMNS
jgi:SNF2 family DNA or RNA helicase